MFGVTLLTGERCDAQIKYSLNLKGKGTLAERIKTGIYCNILERFLNVTIIYFERA